AAAACPLDWRASWGVLRADVGQITGDERARNYARLAIGTRHHPDLSQTIATTALWAQEKAVGLDFWRRALAANPQHSIRIAPLAGELLTADELLAVLPPSPLGRLAIGKALL